MADALTPTASRAHETADVAGRSIWIAAGAFAASLVVVVLAAAGTLWLLHYEAQRALFPTDATPSHMPNPPLQTAAPLDLRALREQKHALLSEYRWVDRAHGVVRIPIERAMDLLAARSATKAQ
jgi:hypothetical protein